jgi:hypothetical protein
MLKKLVAVALLVGLALPHSCHTSPILGAWDGALWAVMFGVPVLVTIAYALHQLLPTLARFHERHGAALHGFFRAICLVLFGVYFGALLGEDVETRDVVTMAISLAVAATLLLWQQGRGTKAQRLPLLLLTIAGLGAVYAFALFVGSGLEYGGWIVTTAWLLAVGAEVNGLSAAARVEHGG